METGLAGRTVVVTGGNANIGRGISLAFAAEGANVVVVGRDEEQGGKVTAQALDRGAAAAMWQRVDVLDRDQVDAMVATVTDRFGGIDVLVNNVGGNADSRPFVGSDPRDWSFDVGLTFTSVLQCTHAVLPGMLARGRGAIVNIGSTAGIVGDTNLAVYSAAKGAVHMFTRILAREVGPGGVRVNCVAPYATLPDDPVADVSRGSRFHPDGVFARVYSTRPEDLTGIRPTALDRAHARPDEIGSAVVYLASDAAAFVTGEVLVVDGGMLVA